MLALSTLFICCAAASDYDGNKYFICFVLLDAYMNLYGFAEVIRFSLATLVVFLITIAAF